jgi:CheY-like chemotaxis protein
MEEKGSLPMSTAARPAVRRLVLAHADAVYAGQAARQFRALGWEVHLASSGPQARQLAQQLRPQAIVLGTELPEESGWLTCAKLARARAGARVILVADRLTPTGQRFTTFVGAHALVAADAGPRALADLLFDKLSAAG